MTMEFESLSYALTHVRAAGPRRRRRPRDEPCRTPCDRRDGAGHAALGRHVRGDPRHGRGGAAGAARLRAVPGCRRCCSRSCCLPPAPADPPRASRAARSRACSWWEGSTSRRWACARRAPAARRSSRAPARYSRRSGRGCCCASVPARGCSPASRSRSRARAAVAGPGTAIRPGELLTLAGAAMFALQVVADRALRARRPTRSRSCACSRSWRPRSCAVRGLRRRGVRDAHRPDLGHFVYLPSPAARSRRCSRCSRSARSRRAASASCSRSSRCSR